MLTIVFDLDGTLVDTAPDLIDTLNYTLKQHGLSVVPFETARPSIGGGARAMIENALASKGRESTPADVDRLYAAFVAHYAEQIADRSRPFPHVEEALDQLGADGYRLAVCTNKLGCRNASWTRCVSANTSPRSAVRTLSGSSSPTRKCFG